MDASRRPPAARGLPHEGDRRGGGPPSSASSESPYLKCRARGSRQPRATGQWWTCLNVQVASNSGTPMAAAMRLLRSRLRRITSGNAAHESEPNENRRRQLVELVQGIRQRGLASQSAECCDDQPSSVACDASECPGACAHDHTVPDKCRSGQHRCRDNLRPPPLVVPAARG